MLGPVVEGAPLCGGGVGLLERDGELAAISDALSGAIEGQGSVLLIEGPAGIGKTSSLQAACERARDRDLRVVTACGFSLEGDFPFGVVRQLFEPVRAAAPEAEWVRLLDGARVSRRGCSTVARYLPCRTTLRTRRCTACFGWPRTWRPSGRWWR